MKYCFILILASVCISCNSQEDKTNTDGIEEQVEPESASQIGD